MSDAWRDFLHQLERERFECLTPEQMEARQRLARIEHDTDAETRARREALKEDS